MRRAFLFSGIFLAFICSDVWSQGVSKRQEVAVFNLCYYDYTIPSGALGIVDDEIRKVFVDLGRFDVIGMSHQLGTDDIDDFIDKIRAYKEKNLVIPEGVSLGREIFTEADFNKLTGSFIVVIPSVSFYNLELEGKGIYKATIRTSISFIDVAGGKTIGSSSIETSGTDRNPREAIRLAASDIPTQLQYEIRKLDAFNLKSGIVEVNGGEVTIEFGRNMGVKVGDEYAIINQHMSRSGYQAVDEAGLLIVKDVQSDYSIAQVIYSDSTPVEGDQIKEIARLGFDFSIYGSMLTQRDGSDIMGVLRGVSTRGFFGFRPAAEIEIPITRMFSFRYFPINLFAGAEIANIYLGRLQVTPFGAVGIGGVIPMDDSSERFYFSHAGVKAQLMISYLMSRDTKVFVAAGYQFMLGMNTRFSQYNGLTIGGGVTFKN